jgi:hypothetical protein
MESLQSDSSWIWIISFLYVIAVPLGREKQITSRVVRTVERRNHMASRSRFSFQAVKKKKKKTEYSIGPGTPSSGLEVGSGLGLKCMGFLIRTTEIDR